MHTDRLVWGGGGVFLLVQCIIIIIIIMIVASDSDIRVAFSCTQQLSKDYDHES